MDLVSFETPEEYRHFALMMHKGEDFGHGDGREDGDGDDDYDDGDDDEQILGRCSRQYASPSDNISSIYTSGRKCNFQDKGCDAAALQPVNINGWFWADGNKKIPATNIPSRLTIWSR